MEESSGSARSTRIGTQIGGYRIESVIGRGGMSVIYLAEQVRLGRKVALKLLAPELAADDRYRERFAAESRLASSINHPNIIPLYDAGEDQGYLYIAMRYIDGPSLRQLMQRNGPLGLGRAIYVIEQVASALDVAHSVGLVHRD
jgi:serine/threonine protein kinase